MIILQTQIEEAQKALCRKYGAEFVRAPENYKSGFALSTKGLTPINGLRHPIEGETTGWYIWCGETYSNSTDFFVPFHTYHLYEEYPEIMHLLGLPPGYRFLMAGDYLDVWFDESLLHVNSEDRIPCPMIRLQMEESKE